MAEPNQYDDLIAQFGSKGKTQNKVVTPYADLINEFGSGSVVAEAPKGETEADILLGPPTPEKFEKSKAIAAAAKEAKLNKPIEFSKLPIVKETIDTFKSSSEMAGSGYSDISKGLTATGVGKVALGHIGQIASPVIGAIEEGTEQLGKITGNPNFAERAALVATSGLPISKIGKASVATMPSSRAINTIVEAIGPENIPAVITQLKSNPRLTLMDVDPNVQIISQGLAAKPGEPRNILDKFVKGRTDTRLDVITGAIDEAMGAPVNVLERVEGLKKQIKDIGKEINPVIANSGPVDVTPVIASMDAKIKPGVTSVISMGEPLPLTDIQNALSGVRKLLTDNKSNRTDATSLHAFQSALRAKAEDLMSSASGQDRQRGYALMQVRNQIVDAIDKVSPQITKADGTVTGSYKPALSKYRDANQIDEAFKKGQLITKNRLGNLEDDPSYWDKWVKEASPVELEAAKEGARLAYAHQLGTVKNAARKGMDIPLIEFNKKKLELLLDEKEVGEMSKTLAAERKAADTDSKLFQNSMTAMRELGAKATEIRPDYKPSYTSLLPLAAEGAIQSVTGGSLPIALTAGYGYLGARKGLTKLGQRLDEKTNVEITNLASATDEARENLIKALQQRVPKTKLSLAQKSVLALPIAKP